MIFVRIYTVVGLEEAVDGMVVTTKREREQGYATRREAWRMLHDLLRAAREQGCEVAEAPWCAPGGEAYAVREGRRLDIVALEPEEARA